MKKLFLLFLSFSVLIACSSDDDTSGGDEILGTWVLVEVNNIPNSDFTLSECNKNSTMTFNEDGSATSIFHAQVEGNCMAGTPANSTWNNESGIYTITIPIPELEGFNTFPGTIDFTSNTFTFTPVASPTTTIVFEKG